MPPTPAEAAEKALVVITFAKLLQIKLHIHQAGILQEARGASRPGLLYRVINLQNFSLMQARTDLQYPWLIIARGKSNPSSPSYGRRSLCYRFHREEGWTLPGMPSCPDEDTAKLPLGMSGDSSNPSCLFHDGHNLLETLTCHPTTESHG